MPIRSWHTRRIGLLAPCGSIAAAAAACCSLRHQYNVGHWAHSIVARRGAGWHSRTTTVTLITLSGIPCMIDPSCLCKEVLAFSNRTSIRVHHCCCDYECCLIFSLPPLLPRILASTVLAELPPALAPAPAPVPPPAPPPAALLLLATSPAQLR